MYLKKFLYRLIIKKLAEEFDKQFTSLGEYTEKYIAFSVPIQKDVTETDKKRRRNYKNHILQITIYW